jgi:hypothetical protein
MKLGVTIRYSSVHVGIRDPLFAKCDLLIGDSNYVYNLITNSKVLPLVVDKVWFVPYFHATRYKGPGPCWVAAFENIL